MPALPPISVRLTGVLGIYSGPQSIAHTPGNIPVARLLSERLYDEVAPSRIHNPGNLETLNYQLSGCTAPNRHSQENHALPRELALSHSTRSQLELGGTLPPDSGGSWAIFTQGIVSGLWLRVLQSRLICVVETSPNLGWWCCFYQPGNRRCGTRTNLTDKASPIVQFCVSPHTPPMAATPSTFVSSSLINQIEVAWAITAVKFLDVIADLTLKNSQGRGISVRLNATFSGAYVVMFGFYLHILAAVGMAKRRFLSAATISLFILCTAHCALELTIPIFRTRAETAVDENVAVSSGVAWMSLVVATNVVYITSNLIANSIFIFRCYAIWNFQRKIIVFPIILALAATGLGYANVIKYFIPDLYDKEGAQFLFDLSILLSLFTTFVLIGLTGLSLIFGRIWWQGRAVRHVMGEKIVKKYCTVSAMMLESGALYGAGAIAFVGASFFLALDSTLTGAILGQLVGIAPTIIAVRMGLGYNVENVDSFSAPKARTQSPAQSNPIRPSMKSVEERVLHIRPDSIQQDMV
ncbi:hypothetical protein FB451DRAFT_1164857 [Mycena latifolia]|nr:hypothetical protein FB451DRAFT_1164857 [Mycena latifolia]